MMRKPIQLTGTDKGDGQETIWAGCMDGQVVVARHTRGASEAGVILMREGDGAKLGIQSIGLSETAQLRRGFEIADYRALKLAAIQIADEGMNELVYPDSPRSRR